MLCFPLILHVTRLPLIWLSVLLLWWPNFFFFFKVEVMKAYHIKKQSCTENKTTKKVKKCCSDKFLKVKRLNTLFTTMGQTVSNGFKLQLVLCIRVYTEWCFLLAPNARGGEGSARTAIQAWCLMRVITCIHDAADTSAFVFFLGRNSKTWAPSKWTTFSINMRNWSSYFCLIFENDNLSLWCFKQFAFFEM